MENNQVPTTAEVPTPGPEGKPNVIEETSQSNTTKPAFDFGQDSLIVSLSYLGPLLIIPYMTKREGSFEIFHIKQGLVLFIAYIILWVFSGFFYFMWPIVQLIQLGLFVLSLVGIVNVLQRKEKELPIIGQFASKIKL